MTVLQTLGLIGAFLGAALGLVLIERTERRAAQKRAESIAEEQQQVIREQCHARTLRLIAGGGKGVH